MRPSDWVAVIFLGILFGGVLVFILMAVIGVITEKHCHVCGGTLKTISPDAMPLDNEGKSLIPPGARYYCHSIACSPTRYYRQDVTPCKGHSLEI